MIRLVCILLIITNIAYGQELKVITSESFLAKDPSIERKTIVKSIVGQFEGKSVSQVELDKIWNNKKFREEGHLVRFQIIDQELYADSFNIAHLYFLKLFDYFQKFIQTHKVQDIDFIIHARDEIEINSLINKEDLEIPTFMMSKDITSIYEKDKLLIPDAHILTSDWSKLIPIIEQASKEKSWDSKIDKVFWRGATNGARETYLYNVSNFDKLARIKIIMLSILYPDLIDARISRYTELSDDQDGRNFRKILDSLFGKVSFISEVDHLKYKYLIAIDGNTCPWVRVPWIMLSNSILIKQETNRVEWFYPALKAYVNYIPVKEELTDIFSQIEWMKNNDKQVQQISRNAQEFIKNDLMPEHIDSHMAIILNEYYKIQKDKKIVASLPKADEMITISSVIDLFLNRVFVQFRRVFEW
jgi:hypothetical protein